MALAVGKEKKEREYRGILAKGNYYMIREKELMQNI